MPSTLYWVGHLIKSNHHLGERDLSDRRNCKKSINMGELDGHSTGPIDHL